MLDYKEVLNRAISRHNDQQILAIGHVLRLVSGIFVVLIVRYNN